MRRILISLVIFLAGCSSIPGINDFRESGKAGPKQSNELSGFDDIAIAGSFSDCRYDTATSSWIIDTDSGPVGLSISIGGRGGWPVEIYDIDTVKYSDNIITVTDPKRTMAVYSYTILY